MKKPKCKRCGRVLRDPRSVARSMGPVCAGDTGRGKTMAASGGRAKPNHSPPVAGSTGKQLPAKAPERQVKPAPDPIQVKALRRGLLRSRLPFRIGFSTRTGQPVTLTPAPDGGWQLGTGQNTSQPALENYLKRYGWI